MMGYYELIEKAALLDDPLLRTVYSLIFSISICNVNKLRLKKPFNPVLGETYEYVEKAYRFFCE